jgi:hypothetical protein
MNQPAGLTNAGTTVTAFSETALWVEFVLYLGRIMDGNYVNIIELVCCGLWLGLEWESQIIPRVLAIIGL